MYNFVAAGGGSEGYDTAKVCHLLDPFLEHFGRRVEQGTALVMASANCKEGFSGRLCRLDGSLQENVKEVTRGVLPIF